MLITAHQYKPEPPNEAALIVSVAMQHRTYQQELQEVNTRQYYGEPFATSLLEVTEAGQQALALLIIVIAILLLSRSSWRLRWQG